MNKKFLSVIGALIILGAFTTSQASVISIEKLSALPLANDGMNKVETRENIIETAIVADEVITIKIVPGEMRFDKTKFSVKAGTTVKVVVENPDFMQHNLLILKPGSLDKVGNAADALAGMANGAELQYVPKIPEVLYSTPLLNQGDKFELTVKVPNVAGEYPFVCTFPGHWRMMSGIMTVTK
ncbi:plastocyanin/azurin family copper-binding protein [Albibacterium bauzanense]|uniref:Azurin n=1 Tax=Albibacterium bauzanense TaxID=653929 RepID=A0A4R1M1Z2_9SPHI|nr:plastocyanin/azurin family copper-binding protein [Albibacterium bauzanense]TCK85705.1 azurin [Albibacterium bauzanense]